MKSYRIAVALKNTSKVLYFSQRAYTRKDALWVIKTLAELEWGKEVASVAALSKKRRAA